jgi:hypothetical protein
MIAVQHCLRPLGYIVTFALHKTEQAGEPHRVVPKHMGTVTFTAY